MEKLIDKKFLHSLKLKAEQDYIQGRYDESTRSYSQILAERSEDLESRVGLLLADMALDHEEESKALYEYYQILKRQNPEESHKIMLELVESFDGNVSEISAMINAFNSVNVDSVKGILYSDFQHLVENRGGFKRAFEDLMFSTKIIITSKEEFLEFLDSLIEYDFSEIALNYLEATGDALAYDPRFQRLYEKAAKR
ncbi:hypothetical protein [Wolinella succinogenes]|uniref:Uncharacterized protein n=1 Tax=Wolinella succinogenes (strain ATCC 29543 / DSM 1740 / CCUG 13145 / JCM 31913 / LMG 7466 / NCTC 11488 / FDC 602W) TaxID=273121 RepID=Q7MR52_WOLSU|nr:hypothetical protein [Wolinella succinogenes]NLU34642.1 hypothetical protein [Wolinella succinogenes]CAE10716.1 conserved hypothetical protein [Wolinella succinogenes]VEG80864.1 Uncharacterised protein [Wolinella succinogenes]HCZ18610.1 hypothetical protein [Helicobacter sp.]